MKLKPENTALVVEISDEGFELFTMGPDLHSTWIASISPQGILARRANRFISDKEFKFCQSIREYFRA